MSPLTEQPGAIWPFLFYTALVVGLLTLMLGAAWFSGERTRGRVTGQPYESGMIPIGGARLRFSVKFYLVAIFFVIFDLEVVYVYAWAVGAIELGWAGYASAMIFLGELTAALIYVWRIGALDWAPKHRRRRSEPDWQRPADPA